MRDKCLGSRLNRVALLSVALAMGLLLTVKHAEAVPNSKKNNVAQTAKKKPEAKAAAPKATQKSQARAPKAVTTTNKQAASPAHRKQGAAGQAKAKRSVGVANANGSRQRPVAQQGRALTTQHAVPVRAVRSSAAHRLSLGEQLGLRHRDDPLELSASVALVMDQETNEILFSKNEAAVLPIASITKLMTGLVVADADLSPYELITITQADVDTYKGSSSRLAVGTTLSREELMHLSLMSSENRAAHALGRTYPGGMSVFVRKMNEKARALGMADTQFVEPTGLSSANRSSARDLAILTAAAYQRPVLRELSTSPSHYLDVGQRVLRFNNSNRLIHNPAWEIGLQKTGYISEAGRCLVMQARIAGRQMIMVLLDSSGKTSRADDAERMRKWIEATTLMQWPERPRS